MAAKPHFRYHDDSEANSVFLCEHLCICGYCHFTATVWTHDSITEDCDLDLDRAALCPNCQEDEGVMIDGALQTKIS